MAYRLKTVTYKGRDCRILLQNENGPCPLLAAANALLLRSNISLPAHCIRNSVASLEDLTNMLANHAMLLSSGDDEGGGGDADTHHYIDELLVHIPKFQYGMDVNPKFTLGVTGYEYTPQLTAFDMLRVTLVHGWLVDPHEQREVYEAVGSDTYNALVEKVIHGNEASTELEKLHQEMAELQAAVDNKTASCDLLDDQNVNNSEQAENAEKLEALKRKCSELHDAATKGSLINAFLHSTAHQLTTYGLQVLYEELKDDELTAFFRNNHFATLTKHEGILYLLVTDLGYANTPNIVWEKLDVIDGDTEYVNHQFKRAGEQSLTTGTSLAPEQLLAQAGQKDADYQLALHLSKQPAGQAAGNTAALDDQEGKLMAAATEASLRSYHGLPDEAKLTATQQEEESKSSEAPNKKEIVGIGVPLGNPTGTVVQLPPPAGSGGAASATTAARPTDSGGPPSISREEADRILAMQLQAENEGHDGASLHLARQLQEEENRRAAATRPAATRPRPQTATTAGAAKGSNCVIS